MEKLQEKAILLGASQFGKSKRKNKRFFVIYNGKIINFGSATGKTFIDHRDKKKRKAWISRHSRITNKQGVTVVNDKTSPSFWSSRILWN